MTLRKALIMLNADDLMSVREAAQAAGVPRGRVNGWITAGRLTTQPGPYSRLVSLAAVQAVAAEIAAKEPRPAPRPREIPDDTAEYVLPSVAARQVGRLPSIVSHWSHTGQVASRPGSYGRLVRLADVEALAEKRRGPRQP
jgi:hypothetical protein